MIFSSFCDKFSGRKFDVLWYLRKYFAQIEKVLRKFRKQNLCWRRVWLIRQLSKTDSDIREMDSNQIFRCSGWTVHLVHNHAWAFVSDKWLVVNGMFGKIPCCSLIFLHQVPVSLHRMKWKGMWKILERLGVGFDWVWLIKEPPAPARQKAINGSFSSLTASSVQGKIQTWNLSKNLHYPIFGRKNFTH